MHQNVQWICIVCQLKNCTAHQWPLSNNLCYILVAPWPPKLWLKWNYHVYFQKWLISYCCLCRIQIGHVSRCMGVHKCFPNTWCKYYTRQSLWNECVERVTSRFPLPHQLVAFLFMYTLYSYAVTICFSDSDWRPRWVVYELSDQSDAASLLSVVSDVKPI